MEENKILEEMNQKLSIITINYNNVEGLKKTFDSINNQTWKDFEYIVIDGGSTDGSKELIEHNQQISYWVSEKDSGVYNAMNKGIKVAKGDYIIFMNSGDFFYNSNVLNDVNHYLDNNISIIYGDAIFFNHDHFSETKIYPDHLSLSFFIKDSLCHQAMFIKTNLFTKYSLYNEEFKICSDWEFNVNVLCSKNEPYLHIKHIICNYDLSGLSANEKYKQLQSVERKKTFEKYFALMINDYEMIHELESKRIKQVLHIKNNKKMTWRFLKWFLDIALIFTNKKKI